MDRIAGKEYYVDPDIETAESLPPSAFTHPEFLQQELDSIFQQAWIPIPDQTLSSQSKPGFRSPFSLLGKPLFAQLNSRNQLNCFPNVCTHAWHPLVEQEGVDGSLVCPQHGRVFDEDGSFVFHKGFEDLKDFPRVSDNLKRFPVGRFGPISFVCLGSPIAPLDHLLDGVRESIPGIDLSSLKSQPNPLEVRELDGNWKQHAWNYMDNYHIRFVHKGPGGLSDAIFLDSYKTELYQYSALQWAYARNPEHGFKPEHVNARFHDPKHPERRVFALWWFIFPNLALNFYPWGLSVNTYMPIPGRPDKTEFRWYQYSLDNEKYRQRKKVWLSEQVDAEDIWAISLVSRGARSELAPRGRFAPQEEAGPHWLHRLIYKTIFEDN